jgi:hypothetical protein
LALRPVRGPDSEAIDHGPIDFGFLPRAIPDARLAPVEIVEAPCSRWFSPGAAPPPISIHARSWLTVILVAFFA